MAGNAEGRVLEPLKVWGLDLHLGLRKVGWAPRRSPPSVLNRYQNGRDRFRSALIMKRKAIKEEMARSDESEHLVKIDSSKYMEDVVRWA